MFEEGDRTQQHERREALLSRMCVYAQINKQMGEEF